MARVINLPGDQIADTIIEGIAQTEAEKNTDAVFRQELMSNLHHITTLLQVMLNHQRVITGIESDNEGDF